MTENSQTIYDKDYGEKKMTDGHSRPRRSSSDGCEGEVGARSNGKYRSYRERYVMLAIFSVLSMSNAIMW